MDANRRNLLIRKRGMGKAALTRIQRHVDAHQQGSDVNIIRVSLEQLSNTYAQYTEIQDELELEDVDEERTSDKEEFEEKHLVLKAKMMSLIQPSSAHSLSPANGTRMIKLPTINIPKFSGVVTDFVHFKDIYTSLIVNNEQLDNIQRFYYLLSSLSGEAQRLVNTMPVTDDNFQIAWNLVKERYDNPRLIANEHAKQLLSLPSATKESASNLRALLNQTVSNRNAIKALKLAAPMDEILISHMLLERVDDTTRREWETQSSSKDFKALDTLIQFTEIRCQAIESMNTNCETRSKINSVQRQPNTEQKQIRSSHLATSTQNQCVACKDNHALHKCSTFLGKDMPQRQALVKRNNLCFNCLRAGHRSSDCPLGNYRTCNMKHHTLLHRSDPNTRNFLGSSHDANSTRNTNNDDQYQQVSASSYHTMKMNPQPQVLLSTALVRVRDNSGNLRICRAFLDSGSQSYFITESLSQIMNLKKSHSSVTVQGINQSVAEAKHRVNIELQSIVSNFKCNIECFVLPRITGELPMTYINYRDWNIPRDLQLADSRFNIPDRIDLLIGAELFFGIMRPNTLKRKGSFPVLQDTELGWILSGGYQASSSLELPQNSSQTFLQTINLDQKLQRFWELEEMNQPIRTLEERHCEQHFSENTERDATGRFVVRLPLKGDPADLGESRHMALQRFLQTERRLHRNPELKAKYAEFLDEYEALGHMRLINTAHVNGASPKYYMPHHPVFKESSSTTKTRVVFDASATAANGKSLNNILMVGPTIQNDLFSIVMRFRTHRICFTADVAKMYRQVRVASQDCRLQRILWRRSSNQPIEEYELLTPYLATRSLQQLTEDDGHNYPRAVTALKEDFYVDDCISSASTVEDALQIQSKLIELLSTVGFPSRKWSSNHAALLQAIPEQLRETQFPLSFDDKENITTLGFLWHPTYDELQIVNGSSPQDATTRLVSTKRQLLATTASIFDPLGLVSPIVISFKIFIQRLWQEGLGWDDHLPPELWHKWQELRSELPVVEQIRFERLVLTQGDPDDIQLHGFADASEQPYGACIYIRSTDETGNTIVKLFCSKSKVAPLKKTTLPRLELCAALLLARLYKKTIESINLRLNAVYLWTDSTIVLAWLNAAPTRWKTFVANRVAENEDTTPARRWQHVASQDNPADLVSRGVSPSSLLGNSLWWNGPTWLFQTSSSWPITAVSANTDIPEGTTSHESITSCVATEAITTSISERFSKLTTLQRVLSYCFRFASNARCAPSERQTGPLTTKEYRRALYSRIKIAQRIEYANEIHAVQTDQCTIKGNKLRDLSPFLCDEQLLRVGGRLQHSQLSYDQRYQIILPLRQHITKLIIENEHLRLLHAGPQLLLSSLRQRFWIVNAKQTRDSWLSNLQTS